MSSPAMDSVPTEIGPTEIGAYLRSHGWVEREGGRLASLWQHDQHTNEEMLVPLRPEARDYDFRLSLLMGQLAKIEKRPVSVVHREITRVLYDVGQVSAEHHEFTNHSVPLQAGLTIFTATSRMVVASAASTIRRQSFFGRTVPPEARQHARRVRVGHTVPGSYIVPVFSRVIPDTDPAWGVYSAARVDASPFDRQVMTTFANALRVLHEITVARDAEPTANEITDSVSEGVTWDLCQAVSDVTGSSLVNQLEIRFDWSPATRPPAIESPPARFPSEATSIIRKVADTLRRTKREEDVIYGKITRLEYRDGDPTGRVTIETEINGRPRRVWVTLAADDYRRALQLHDQQEIVAARGPLLNQPSGQITMIATSLEPALPSSNS